MADLRKDLAALRDPSHIHNAQLASSPYVLRKVLAADPTVRRVIASGERVVPLIAEEIREPERLDEITLSALAFIVENVSAQAAPWLFGALFRRSLEEPGPFFIHFVAHAMRVGLGLPVRPLQMVYSRAELAEVQATLG